MTLPYTRLRRPVAQASNLPPWFVAWAGWFFGTQLVGHGRGTRPATKARIARRSRQVSFLDAALHPPAPPRGAGFQPAPVVRGMGRVVLWDLAGRARSRYETCHKGAHRAKITAGLVPRRCPTPAYVAPQLPAGTMPSGWPVLLALARVPPSQEPSNPTLAGRGGADDELCRTVQMGRCPVNDHRVPHVQRALPSVFRGISKQTPGSIGHGPPNAALSNATGQQLTHPSGCRLFVVRLAIGLVGRAAFSAGGFSEDILDLGVQAAQFVLGPPVQLVEQVRGKTQEE